MQWQRKRCSRVSGIKLVGGGVTSTLSGLQHERVQAKRGTGYGSYRRRMTMGACGVAVLSTRGNRTCHLISESGAGWNNQYDIRVLGA